VNIPVGQIATESFPGFLSGHLNINAVFDQSSESVVNAVSKPQSGQKKVDCNSGARQVVKFANNVSLTAGGSAVVMAALGAEPPAGLLAGGALVADGVSAIAGGYVYLTEGDSGPLKSSFVGAAFGALGGGGVKLFGGKSYSPFSGIRVSVDPSAAKEALGGLLGGQAGGAIPAQICP
jgi:hypothetical protein